jgi:hypothetical protein
MLRTAVLPVHSVQSDTEPEHFSYEANGRHHKQPKLTYLLDRRVALGTLTIVEGRKGAGKSTFMAALAADVTGGPRLPGGRKRRVLGSVLWLTREEDYHLAVLPRIVAAGGNPKLIKWPQPKNGDGPPRMVFPGQFGELEWAITNQGIKLLVMDPWASFLDVGANQNDEQQVRAVTERLIDIGHRTGCALVLARHLRKNSYGRALDHGSGSVAIGAAARSVLRIDAFPGKPNWCVAVRVGGNIGAAPPALAWELMDAGNVAKVAWRGEYDIDPDALAAGTADIGERDERDDATGLLRGMLKEKWVPFTNILKAARNSGISERTLRARKAELHIPSRRQSGNESHWYEWGPPPGGWPK